LTCEAQELFTSSIILNSAVESRKSARNLDEPRKLEKCFITNKVTTNFSNFLCTPISSTAFSRRTAESRMQKIEGVSSVVALENVDFKSLVEEKMSRYYQRAEVKQQYFDSKAKAQEWMGTLSE